MRLTRHFPKTLAALRDLTVDSVGNASSVVFQAGHFLLVYDEASGTLSPCLRGAPASATNPVLFENYGNFPILTWKLALRLLSQVQATTKSLMIVVNDWQYLPKGVKRFDFYRRQEGRLPHEFESEMKLQAPSATLLEPLHKKDTISTAPFYGELTLRNRYASRVNRMISSEKLPESAVVTKGNAGVTCELPDATGALQEIYCSGKTGDCAGEIAEMLREANSRTGATAFVNLYPLVCRGYVELGTSRANELFKVPMKTVLNLGFPSSGIFDEDELIEGCEASLHRFS